MNGAADAADAQNIEKRKGMSRQPQEYDKNDQMV